ncbi:hypothetical protein K402DRAFT_394824 [Aulographum hederae CBS 113979]|uniref:BTB domain-containing protein n=1 Tax=Aulographum hederae CBS 113979 TaxID=1176131 RepID=A0A6G1GXG8_9PEZI|nr:hypothetical protein K402DRAFT_394824 [Aulographum hederae CBS 113979]
MHLGLRSHFRCNRYTDLRLVAGEKTYNVHRIVLCSQAKWFERLCFRHKDLDKISINMNPKTKDEEKMIATMVHYFYNSDYKDTAGVVGLVGASKNEPFPEELGYWNQRIFNLRIWGVGHQFDIPDLRELAIEKFCTVKGVTKYGLYKEEGSDETKVLVEVDRYFKDACEMVYGMGSMCPFAFKRGLINDFAREFNELRADTSKLMSVTENRVNGFECYRKFASDNPEFRHDLSLLVIKGEVHIDYNTVV